MERFLRAVAWAVGMEEGRSSVMRWWWREGRRVWRTENQWAERRVRRGPLEGMPCWG